MGRIALVARLVAVAGAVAAGCSSQSPTWVCSPGTAVVCTCPQGSKGSALCSDDGLSIGACNGCAAPDLGSNDLSDMSMPDMSMPDQSMSPADLSQSADRSMPDQAAPLDFSMQDDLAMPDLAMPDLVHPADMSFFPDATVVRDMTVPPADLTVVCGNAGQPCCGGAAGSCGGFCLARFTYCAPVSINTCACVMTD
jgi:hypothetical protein